MGEEMATSASELKEGEERVTSRLLQANNPRAPERLVRYSKCRYGNMFT